MCTLTVFYVSTCEEPQEYRFVDKFHKRFRFEGLYPFPYVQVRRKSACKRRSLCKRLIKILFHLLHLTKETVPKLFRPSARQTLYRGRLTDYSSQCFLGCPKPLPPSDLYTLIFRGNLQQYVLSRVQTNFFLFFYFNVYAKEIQLISNISLLLNIFSCLQLFIM